MTQKYATLFQSQAGFVPLCDPTDHDIFLVQRAVSIPGGICSSLRLLRELATLIGFDTVSIPGGICSSLRLELSVDLSTVLREFQSQAGGSEVNPKGLVA